MCLLTTAASGHKLQPYIIFKGQRKKSLFHELQKMEKVKNKNIFLSTQENAWLYENLFLDYIKKIILSYMPNKK